jgi:hypothetical protein
LAIKVTFITETFNGELALVIGAPITMDSITFSSKQEHTLIKDRIMRDDFYYGDEIVIETPACVNAKVCQSLDGTNSVSWSQWKTAKNSKCCKFKNVANAQHYIDDSNRRQQ